MFIQFPKLNKAVNLFNLCELFKLEQEIAVPNEQNVNGHTEQIPTQVIPGIGFHFVSGDKQMVAFDTIEERDRVYQQICSAIHDKELTVYGTGSKIVLPGGIGMRQ